jgi:hypothetical protein
LTRDVPCFKGLQPALGQVREKTGFRGVWGAWNASCPWVERAKKQLKHFSCRGCERGGYAGAVTPLCVHRQPSESLADHVRVRVAGRMLRGHRPGPASRAEPPQSGDWRSQERGSRCPQRDPTRALRHFDSRPRSREPRRNAAIFPESSAIHSETDLPGLQNSRLPSAERVRNAAILPESAAVHSERVLQNVQNSPRRSGDGRRNATILPETACAREAHISAGESPVGAIRRFSTADRANCVAARRGGEQAWSRNRQVVMNT